MTSTLEAFCPQTIVLSSDLCHVQISFPLIETGLFVPEASFGGGLFVK